MALSYKQKRRWSLIILLIGLPIYVIVAMVILALIGGLPLWVQVIALAVLGIAWVLPFKQVFLGVGQADPDAADPPTK